MRERQTERQTHRHREREKEREREREERERETDRQTERERDGKGWRKRRSAGLTCRQTECSRVQKVKSSMVGLPFSANGQAQEGRRKALITSRSIFF